MTIMVMANQGPRDQEGATSFLVQIGCEGGVLPRFSRPDQHEDAPNHACVSSFVMAALHATSRRRVRRIVCCLSAFALLSVLGRRGSNNSPRWFPFSVQGPARPPWRGGASNPHTGDGRSASPSVVRRPLFYSTLRPDRAGAVVQDMLLAHAFAFARNLTYGGACPPHASEEGRRRPTNLTEDQVSELLFHLGLDDVLPIACPPPSSENNTGNDTLPPLHPRAGPLVDRKYYGRYNLRFCTGEWQRYMRAKVQRRIDATRSSHPSDRGTAALHVRRGDVTPCDPATSERYLPNSYYLELLDRYVPKHYRVTIYSEHTSIEPWDDFRNYTLRLDSGGADDHSPLSSMRDLARIWLDMVTADVLVLSKSSFSLVPALLRASDPAPSPPPPPPHGSPPHEVVYTDFWMDPLPGWTRVPPSLQRRAALDAERVKRERCAPRDSQ